MLGQLQWGPEARHHCCKFKHECNVVTESQDYKENVSPLSLLFFFFLFYMGKTKSYLKVAEKSCSVFRPPWWPLLLLDIIA